MNENYVSVIEVAQEIGKRKQSIFKIIKKLQVVTVKKKSEDSRGQEIAYITDEDRMRILEYVENSKDQSEIPLSNDETLDEELVGIFYLIQLEPEHDPLRVKFGFTINISERLRKHRCSAPFAQLIKTWRCKMLWERTAMDCVSMECQQLHTEVFRVQSSIDSMISKLDQFFALMPQR